MTKSLLLALLLPLMLFAYVDLQPKRVGEVKGFGGDIAVDGTISRGNTYKESVSLSTKLEQGSSVDKYLFLTSYTYGQSRSIKDTNRAMTHLRYTHVLVKSYDIELFSQLEYNEFQSLKNRSLFGANLRKELPLWRTFFIGLGLMYSYMEPIEIDGDDLIYRRIKVNSYMMSTYAFNAMVKVNYLLFYQPNIKQVDDFTLFGYLQLQSKLTEKLAFSINMKYEYNATPYSGRMMQDLTAKAGIGYRF